MKNLNVKQFGLAFGLTGIFLYAGCLIIMLLLGKEGSVLFFNTLLHGLDTSSIIRMSIPWQEVLIGVVATFIIAWLLGACIAVIYNISAKREKK